MSVGRRIVEKVSDAAARFKAGGEERQEQGTQTNDCGRSPANSSENGSRTPFSESGDALDVSPSGDSRDRDATQDTDGTRNLRFDRQHSTRTTDLRQLDGHESWRGVARLTEASEGVGHE